MEQDELRKEDMVILASRKTLNPSFNNKWNPLNKDKLKKSKINQQSSYWNGGNDKKTLNYEENWRLKRSYLKQRRFFKLFKVKVLIMKNDSNFLMHC